MNSKEITRLIEERQEHGELSEVVDKKANARTIMVESIKEFIVSALPETGVLFDRKEKLVESVDTLLEKCIVPETSIKKFAPIVGLQASLVESKLHIPIEELLEHYVERLTPIIEKEINAVIENTEDKDHSGIYKIFTTLKENSLKEKDELLREDSDSLLEKSIILSRTSAILGYTGVKMTESISSDKMLNYIEEIENL